MNATVEEWRPIPGFDGYEVSDLGRLRSWRPYRGTAVPRVLASHPNGSGYLTVGVMANQRRVGRLVHRLVLLAFAGDCPPGHEARHLDGDQLNNAQSNLAWAPHSVNLIDRRAHGTVRNQNSAKTHCRRGHPLTEGNIYWSGGHRQCRTCSIEKERRRGPRQRGHAAHSSAKDTA